MSVHPGANKPFCRKAAYARDIQGKTGLDGTTHLPEPKAKAVERPNAMLAMRHALLSEPKGSAWLVATGTLTNIALLFATFPEVVEHIKGLSIMGGAIGGGFTGAPMGKVVGEGERFGNWTPWAEFNIYVSQACIDTRTELADRRMRTVRSRSRSSHFHERGACCEDDVDTARFDASGACDGANSG